MTEDSGGILSGEKSDHQQQSVVSSDHTWDSRLLESSFLLGDSSPWSSVHCFGPRRLSPADFVPGASGQQFSDGIESQAGTQGKLQ